MNENGLVVLIADNLQKTRNFLIFDVPGRCVNRLINEVAVGYLTCVGMKFAKIDYGFYTELFEVLETFFVGWAPRYKLSETLYRFGRPARTMGCAHFLPECCSVRLSRIVLREKAQDWIE